MKNILVITSDGEQLVSSIHDTTNRLLINDSEIDNSLWVGSGNYTDTINGHAITITKAPDLTGNYQLVKISDYHYEFRNITSGSTGNYENLTNKPQINNVELIGNKSFINLGLTDFFYPVGSYYETSDSSFDPNITWGGTWELEAEGLVHIGSGTNYAVGATGGEKEHTLTIAEMPNHSHTTGIQGSLAGAYISGNQSAVVYFNQKSGVETAVTGGGQAHNNMQPYVVVNRWHRTA